MNVLTRMHCDPFLDRIIQHIILHKRNKQQNNKKTRHTGGATVFWKRHTGKPLCCDPMIQIMILLEMSWANESCKITPYRAATVFWKRHTGKPLV